MPKSLTSSQRRELADLVIEHIYDRTDRGLDANGKPFKKYSKSYVESLAGQVGGKSKGRVNLQLSGDMLAAMTVLSHSEGEIKIGWKNKTERQIAEGNILGSYGDSSPHPDRARDFLGIKKDKLKDLIDAVNS